MTEPAPPSRVRVLLQRAALVWSVVAIVAYSDTGVAFPVSMLLTAVMVVIVTAWLIVLVIAVLSARAPDRRSDTLRSWIGVPAPIVATLVLISLAVPLRARLFLSGPALQQSAAFLAQLPPSRFQERPPWIGLFRVRGFAQFGDELRFLTSRCGFADNCGLVYSPGGPPPNRREDSFEHIYGGWWHWHQSW